MKLITIEEHFSSKSIQQLCQPYINPSLSKKQLNPELEDFYRKISDHPDLYNLPKRLQFMADNGVNHQILSYINTIASALPADKPINIYRKANDELADMVASHPDKFSAFTLLPLQDPHASAAELERCVKTLGFKGV